MEFPANNNYKKLYFLLVMLFFVQLTSILDYLRTIGVNVKVHCSVIYNFKIMLHMKLYTHKAGLTNEYEGLQCRMLTRNTNHD